MKKSRFTDEQNIGLMRQAEAGISIKKVCRGGGFSDATFFKWRAKYSGMQSLNSCDGRQDASTAKGWRNSIIRF